jgi:hypothetical protein
MPFGGTLAALRLGHIVKEVRKVMSLPLLFKGAGPGTHWHRNDARLSGFVAAASSVVNRNSVERHITAYSFPSPLLSLSASYAVARQYALSGPSGHASKAAPGYVYEIDPTNAPVTIHDPIAVLVATDWGHIHTGDQSLLPALATGGAGLLPACLHNGNIMQVPSVGMPVRALVYAIRDSELLAVSVPTVCITNRHEVF